MNLHHAIALIVSLGLASQASAILYNVAEIGTATQSSTRAGASFQGDHAQYAVDGNTDGSFNNGSVTHTNTQSNPWWQVDLQTTRSIDDIVVWNRTDCCSGRLDGFKLSILDESNMEVFSAFPSTPAPSESVNVGGVAGRFVRVDLPGASEILSLAEVEVFADVPADDPLLFRSGRNLALQGEASQSSTRTGPPKGNQPILAIDGNTDGTFNNLSVTHTNAEPSPSWMVDLGQTQAIDNIVAFERTDGCCNGRLSNGTVSVLDSSMNEVFSTNFGSVSTELFVPVDFGVEGQFVKVQLNDTGSNRTLELAEVKVFGGDLFNVARNPEATATQSTTFAHAANPVAGKAIDGITDGDFFAGSVATTQNQPDSFWEVDFGDEYEIDNIRLFNRGDCCGGRLSNFRVSIFSDAGEVFGQDYFTGMGSVAQGGDFFIDVADFGRIVGDRVRVQLLGLNNDGNGFLSLAEVQVFGSAIPEPMSAVLGVLGFAALAGRRRRA